MCWFFSSLPGHTAQARRSSETKKRVSLRASSTVGPPSAPVLSSTPPAPTTLSPSSSSSSALRLESLCPPSPASPSSSKGLFRFRIGLSEPLGSLPDSGCRHRVGRRIDVTIRQVRMWEEQWRINAFLPSWVRNSRLTPGCCLFENSPRTLFCKLAGAHLLLFLDE